MEKENTNLKKRNENGPANDLGSEDKVEQRVMLAL